MFRQLFSALKSGDVLDRAFSEFSEMLDHAEWMFIRANEVLNHKVPPEEVRDSIYDRDKGINDLLKGIRRKIVRHLTISPGGDAPACLALMSVAKDAERIGDYCKNVFEVGRFYTEEFRVERYHEPLEEVRNDVERLFTAVRGAWGESDHKAAKQAIKAADEIRRRCDEIISRLLGDQASIQTHEAVAYSLLARHYKRVAAHLANISTAVTGRIEDLDFRR
ncbi:MAG: PhoU domain-containing protein [Planctomycetota bacterium]|nr:PhoU domain-containing protein [Planctomycetota bacterium]